MQSKSNPQYKNFAVAGFLILALFCGSIVAWSTLVPLDASAMAPGKLVVQGQSKTIQHFEGGIVKELHVEEGAQVREGDLLIQLDATRAKASMDLLMGQYLSLLTQIDRLNSEIAGNRTIQWSDTLSQLNDDRKNALIYEQNSLFYTRLKQHQERIEILQERVNKNEEAISQLNRQVDRVKRQERLYRSEIGIVAPVVEAGLADRPLLWGLQRELASTEEHRSTLESRIENLISENRENEIQIAAQDSNRYAELKERLAELQTQRSDLEQRLLAAEDVLSRTQIRAPIAGQVMNLAVTTLGGTINSSEPLMDIVPEDHPFIVEARIAPVDIDVVAPGQAASIRLGAYSRRFIPAIDGELLTVSSDRIQDPNISEEPFYLAQIALDMTTVEGLGLRLQAGMPIEVTLKTEPQTMADYLLEPVMRSFDRAFTLN